MKGAIRIIFAVGIMLLFFALPGHALHSEKVSVEIPFAFTAGDNELPAGEYTVQREGSLVFLTHATDPQLRATLNTTPLNEPKSDTEARLVFRRHGDQAFLKVVQATSHAMGREVLTSETEKKAAESPQVRKRYTVTVDSTFDK